MSLVVYVLMAAQRIARPFLEKYLLEANSVSALGVFNYKIFSLLRIGHAGIVSGAPMEPNSNW
jgi:hypothetical protein